MLLPYNLSLSAIEISVAVMVVMSVRPSTLPQMDDLASDKHKFTKLLTHNKCIITD